MTLCEDLHDLSQFWFGVNNSEFGLNSYHFFKFWYDPTRFRCPNLDWNFKIFRTKFGLILNLSKNDHSNKNALPCRCVKISLIQANFDKLWPSLNLVQTATIFSSFGTNTSKNTLVPKLEKMVAVRTKIRLGHTFPKLTWIMEIFTLRHGSAFLIK